MHFIKLDREPFIGTLVGSTVKSLEQICRPVEIGLVGGRIFKNNSLH